MKNKKILITLFVILILVISFTCYTLINTNKNHEETKNNVERILLNAIKEDNGENNGENNTNLKNGGKDDYGSDTYYFVSDSDNNYVSFADFTWRIVRINGDETVRLVLYDYIRDKNGKIIETGYVKDGKKGKSFEEAKKDISYKKSLVKEKVNKWVKENFSDDELNKVAKSKFCHDYSGKKDGKIFKFGAYLRELNKEESVYYCSDSSGIFESKFALLTYDEVKGKNNKKDFMEFMSLSFVDELNYSSRSWLLSPYDITSSFNYNTGSRSSDDGLTMYSFGFTGKEDKNGKKIIGIRNTRMDRETNVIQPVMSLKKDVKVIGNGTKENPYKIK